MRNRWVSIALIILSLVLVGGTIMACTIASPIVGKWQDTQENNAYLEFLSDGHVIINTARGNVSSGTYELVGSEYVKVTFEGIAGAFLTGFGANTWKYQISGDTMKLEWGGQTTAFKRIR